MSPLSAGFVAYAFRWGSSSAPWYETVAIVGVIAVMAVACVIVFRSLRRRDRRPRPVRDQWQALAVMGELCPHGWQAHITLYGEGAPMPADAPLARRLAVELEWRRFDGEARQIAAARRVSARSIAGALQMMVDDCRTDVELERIGQVAGKQPDEWWSD